MNVVIQHVAMLEDFRKDEDLVEKTFSVHAEVFQPIAAVNNVVSSSVVRLVHTCTSLQQCSTSNCTTGGKTLHVA